MLSLLRPLPLLSLFICASLPNFSAVSAVSQDQLGFDVPDRAVVSNATVTGLVNGAGLHKRVAKPRPKPNKSPRRPVQPPAPKKSSTTVSKAASASASVSASVSISASASAPTVNAAAASSSASSKASSASASASASASSASPDVALFVSVSASASASASAGKPTTGASTSTSTTGKTVVATGLQLVQSWSGANFLNGFTFFNYADPTEGAVNFVNAQQAKDLKMAYTTSSGSTILRVDNGPASTSYNSATKKRNSVRISSNAAVRIGSIVMMDAAKLPWGPSVWPAYWMVGSGVQWPHGGEIDIIEGVNSQTQNLMTLHTTPGCTLANPLASGKVLTTTCDTSVNYNTGCSFQDPSTESYASSASDNFNAVGGGVFVMSYQVTGIQIWRFRRDSIPADIKSGATPNPASWGTPMADWPSATCPMDKYFSDQTITFDITLCGDWAGWNYPDGGMDACMALVPNSRNYDNAFFEINYVKVWSTVG